MVITVSSNIVLVVHLSLMLAQNLKCHFYHHLI